MGRKIAILSNVNCNPLVRLMKADYEVYEPEGYGGELLLLLDPISSYHKFQPDVTFLWIDLMELIHHDLGSRASAYVEEWFAALEKGLTDGGMFYISDAHLHGPEVEVLADLQLKYDLEAAFRKKLRELCDRHRNVFVLPLTQLAESVGADQAYSDTLWYLGKIPYSQAMQNKMCESMRERIRVSQNVAKKVLVLDLDNTLWGGLAGEAEHTPVQLSEEHRGLAYKNLQRVIRQMKQQGVLLAVASKNNEADALEIIEKHPHMVLKKEDFVNLKINWLPKAQNLQKMAEELNLGLDSFVFWDDSETERAQMRQLLPVVTVPEFPSKPEKLAAAMTEIYHLYFEKQSLTREDLEKTDQYAANAKRQQLKEQALDLPTFLRQLDICVQVEEADKNPERLHQLVNKTNQFNLTTVRYSREQLAEYINSRDKLVRLYRVTDKFGDNGIVGVAIVDLAGETPRIESFLLSCRVMGRCIENGIIDKLEQELAGMGYHAVEALYRKTAKNQPVEQLYEGLGYQVAEQCGDEKRYRRDLREPAAREYYFTEWRQ